MRHLSLTLAILLTMSLLGSLSVLAQATHPFSIHDMLAMDRISGQQVSPDGQRVVFVVRTTDMDANKGRTDLWLVGVDGSNLRQLTTHAANDNSPVWAPDGTAIYFLSTRSGSSQVWKLPISGGEPRQITHQPLDVSNLILSRDGTRIAFSMDVFPDCETLDCTTERLSAKKRSKSSGAVHDRVFVRHWDTWKDGRRSHVFVHALGTDGVTDVMRGMDADCPSKPFGGAEEMTFTPDSNGIVFSARDAGAAEAWSTDLDLYFSPLDGSVAPRCLTESNAAWDTSPVFSPDGRTLSYLAMERAGYESDRMRIMLQPWPEGEPRTLTLEWDRSARYIVWAADSKTIFTAASNVGQVSLFGINTASGKVQTIVREGTVRSPQIAGKKLLFGLEHLKSPVELYTVEPNGKNQKQITQINSARVAATRMGDTEQFSFRGWNDETVYCYVVKPADFDPARKYPVAFLIHGGPQGSFGNSFHYRWNPQAYAGAGYAAVMVDFHGSTGYGQVFTDAIRGDWGGKPLEDLQKGLAAALERYPWMDAEHVGALGASYGGYMINWIAGNWPDRFRCLVNHDGNLDERMAYFNTEELWFPEWDHEGTPWDNPDGYAKHNPINHVDKWKTPMLVIHGALDYRVVDTQGIATFNLLQRRGIPSRFLYFPDENHWVLKPHNSVLWHDTVIEWMDRWVKPENADAHPDGGTQRSRR